MLHPINAQSLDDALALLLKGFPVHDETFWRDGIGRLQRHHDTHGLGPIGYLMGPPGDRTGVALTMISERQEPDGRRRRVVNLSSWYVEETARWLAPLMLQRLTAEPDTIFTDLTPSPSVRKLIANLGFQPWNERAVVAFLPWAAVVGGGTASVVAGAALAAAGLSQDQRRLVDEHAGLGCLTAALSTDTGTSPLVFLRTWRRGLPSARLIYAESKRELFRQFGAIARHLLAQGIVCAVIPAHGDDVVPGGWFTTAAPPTFYKGPMMQDRIDHAWSELVFLRL